MFIILRASLAFSYVDVGEAAYLFESALSEIPQVLILSRSLSSGVGVVVKHLHDVVTLLEHAVLL